MLVIHGENGPLGNIRLQAGLLTGDTPGTQAMADEAVASTGSAQAAYDKLSQLGNGYLDAEEVPDLSPHGGRLGWTEDDLEFE